MDISIFDSSWNPTETIDAFESFLWTVRFDDAGDFVLYDDVSLDWINWLKKDYFLHINESDRHMIIEDIVIDTDADGKNKLKITGRTLESILDRRIVWGQKVLTGNLQNGIKILLNENLIAPTDSDRKIDDVVFIDSIDPIITALTLDAQLYCDNLLETIVKQCKAVNIGFKFLRVNGKYEFSLYAGTDRSEDQSDNTILTFSPNMDNLLNSQYVLSGKKEKTISAVAGEGEGSERTLVSSGDSSKIGMARKETFVNASDLSKTTDGGTISDTDYQNQLKQRGLEALKELDLIEAFDGQVDTGGQYIYDRDFFMGDIIQIENEYGMKTKSKVVEMIRSYDNEGIEQYPTFRKI